MDSLDSSERGCDRFDLIPGYTIRALNTGHMSPLLSARLREHVPLR
jgi:hypothetical protein